MNRESPKGAVLLGLCTPQLLLKVASQTYSFLMQLFLKKLLQDLRNTELCDAGVKEINKVVLYKNNAKKLTAWFYRKNTLMWLKDSFSLGKKSHPDKR